MVRERTRSFTGFNGRRSTSTNFSSSTRDTNPRSKMRRRLSEDDRIFNKKPFRTTLRTINRSFRSTSIGRRFSDRNTLRNSIRNHLRNHAFRKNNQKYDRNNNNNSNSKNNNRLNTYRRQTNNNMHNKDNNKFNRNHNYNNNKTAYKNNNNINKQNTLKRLRIMRNSLSNRGKNLNRSRSGYNLRRSTTYRGRARGRGGGRNQSNRFRERCRSISLSPDSDHFRSNTPRTPRYRRDSYDSDGSFSYDDEYSSRNTPSSYYSDRSLPRSPTQSRSPSPIPSSPMPPPEIPKQNFVNNTQNCSLSTNNAHPEATFTPNLLPAKTLVLTGIKDNRDPRSETLINLLIKIGEKLNVTLHRSDIDSISRLEDKDSDKIKVVFMHSSIKKLLMKNIRFKKCLSTSEIGLNYDQQIYLNDELSLFGEFVFRKARYLKAKRIIENTWTVDGKVKYKIRPGDVPITCKTLEELLKLEN